MRSSNSLKPVEAKKASAIPGPTKQVRPPDLAARSLFDELVHALLDQYKRHGKPKSVNFRKLVPQLTSTDRLTHLLHPYPAKLLAHIPFLFLNNSVLSQPGDMVLDPFCGSGTVLLEALSAGRRACGADSNPLARLISHVKTTPIAEPNLKRSFAALLRRVPKDVTSPAPDVVNLEHWFYPSAIRKLTALWAAIALTPSPAMRAFFAVCFSACVRKVSLADPRLAVPVRLRKGQYPSGHLLRDKTDAHLRRLRCANVRSIFSNIVKQNIRRVSTLTPYTKASWELPLIATDARRLAAANGHTLVPDSTVQLVITSPPYPGAQKYIRSCSLSLGWLELCSVSELRGHKAQTIGREEFPRKTCQEIPSTGLASADRVLRQLKARNSTRAMIAATYLIEMREVLQEIRRILKDRGYLVLVAANSRTAGRPFRTVSYLREIAEAEGFQLVLSMVDAIKSRGLMTKRNSTASVITREWVLVFQKAEAAT